MGATGIEPVTGAPFAGIAPAPNYFHDLWDKRSISIARLHLPVGAHLNLDIGLAKAASYVVMMPDLATTQPADIRLCPIGAGTVESVGFLVIDPAHFEMAVQRVPVAAFVGVDDGALSNP